MKDLLRKLLIKEAMPSDMKAEIKKIKSMSLDELKKNLDKVSKKIDKIVKDGGQVGLADPLSQLLKATTQEIKRIKKRDKKGARVKDKK